MNAIYSILGNSEIIDNISCPTGGHNLWSWNAVGAVQLKYSEAGRQKWLRNIW